VVWSVETQRFEYIQVALDLKPADSPRTGRDVAGVRRGETQGDPGDDGNQVRVREGASNSPRPADASGGNGTNRDSEEREELAAAVEPTPS
jgi:hypothetical protein